MADSPVQVDHVDETIPGQGGDTRVRETYVVTDRVITDPDDPLASQVPDHPGASSVGEGIALADALRRGTAEEQLAAAEDESDEDDE